MSEYIDLRGLKESALEELKTALKERWYSDVEEGIFELSDSWVPIYYGDLLQVCVNSPECLEWVHESREYGDIGSIYDILKVNIYWEIWEHLQDSLVD